MADKKGQQKDGNLQLGLNPGFTTNDKPPPGFSPYAPVLRAGHYDHIPESLQPKDDGAKELIERHPLEKSSSSFLNRLMTPPSTDSENEPGRLGLHMLCFGKKKHHVDKLYKIEREADRLGYILLFFAILSYLPAFGMQCVYLWVPTFRHSLLNNYEWVIGVFFFLIFLSFVLKYFSGICRKYPYNIIMCITKSAVFATFYVFAALYVEFLFIAVLIRLNSKYGIDENYNHVTDEEELDRKWHSLYDQYVTNNATANSEVPNHTKNYMLIFGISYGLALMVLMMLIVKYSKISFFGATYPFVSYSITFGIIFTSSAALLIWHKTWFPDRNKSILWELAQVLCGPIIGCVLAEMYVHFLDRLLSGRMCPMKAGEYAYAMAQF